jgi:hypothetical protein
MSECTRTKDLLLQWEQGGELAAGDAEAVESHCASCAECRGSFASILPFLLRDARGVPVDPSVPSSPAFTSAVMDRIGERAPARISPRLSWAVAAAASVVLLAGIGYGAYRLGTSRASSEVLVHFQLAAPGAGSVALVGSFTGWETAKLPMTDADSDGVWEVSVRLRKEAVHTYNFLIDGTRWVSDPAAEGQVDDGFGGQSSIVAL